MNVAMNADATNIPRIKILTFVGCYLPGYKAGGPIRTIANIIDRLGDELEFKVVTADRDLHDTKAYPGIVIDGFNRLGKADVYYASPRTLSLKDFRKIINSIEFDIIYMNSFFSPPFTIKPLLLRKLRLIPTKPLILAPRGEFSSGALGLKSLKKRAYRLMAKALGLYRGITWQASSVYEEADIHQWFGKHVPVVVAPDLPPVLHSVDELPPKNEKDTGRLKILFLSRISQMKNLKGALKILNVLEGKIQFNIYGAKEDKNYWLACQKIINSLPENIQVRYCGSVAHDKVGAVMREHDIFFLPTFGENFGHVILEALCVGCPVLISDRTPWRDLESKKVGWDLPLEQPERFHAVLQKCVDMSHEDYVEWSQNACKYGYQITQDNHAVSQNRSLFQKAITSKIQNTH